ncbi:MAG: ABC transporter permease [Vicinamibacterales bacterium]
MPTFFQDLRGGVRGLFKSPTHTAVAVLTIALGIGVNTTMFSIVQAVLLRPLPFHNPEALVTLNADLPGLNLSNVGFAVPEIEDLAARSDVFEQVTPVWVFDANLTGGQRPERVVMVASGPDYFAILGAHAQLGRVLGPEDKTDGFAEAVVLSDAAWRRLFGGDPSAIGRQVRIDTDLYTIVGVMPPTFHHPAAAPAPDIDVWSVCGFRANPFPPTVSRRNRFLPSAMARVRPGVTVEAARAGVDTLVTSIRRDYAADYPAEGRWSIRLDPLRDVVVGNVHPLLLAFSAAVALVLLIGCANVANLLLARASTRQREIAIRLAIGAGRGRLVRQLLTENLVLAVLGGSLGLVAVLWTQSLLIASMPADLPRVNEIGIDWIAVGFAMTITLLTSFAFGIAPAWQASRTRPAAAIADVGRGLTGSRQQRRLRTTLVIAEIALSLVLVAGAGLLVATVNRLLTVDAGFDPTGVTTARTWIAVPNNPDLDPYRTGPSRTTLSRRLLDHLREIPGVSLAAMTTVVPLSQAQAPFRAPVQVDGQLLDAESSTAELVAVSPDYFALLNIPLVRGRGFAETDDGTAQPVIVIDEDAERRFFPGVDAVGRSLRIGRAGPQGPPPAIAIVGVVKTVKHDRLDEPATPHVYASIYQRSGRSLGLLVKTRTGGGDAVQEPMRRAVESTDRDLPVFAMESMDDTVGRSIAKQRFSAQALAAFAATALLLVIGGVYGVTAYAVTSRTQEIGVRIAMGASHGMVVRGVLAEALRASAIGVAIGLVLALLATRLIRTMLFDVSSIDPRVYAVACLLLIAATMLAAYLPARRAARVDPLMSLRAE